MVIYPNQFTVFHTIAGETQDSQADNDRLMALFPDVEPDPVSDGRRATIAWAREQVG